MDHIDGRDLERYHLGLLFDRYEIAELEKHVAACTLCATLSREIAEYADEVRAALHRRPKAHATKDTHRERLFRGMLTAGDDLIDAQRVEDTFDRLFIRDRTEQRLRQLVAIRRMVD